MKTIELIAHGFRTARRHPRLVVITWWMPLLAALVLASLIAFNIGPVLGRSLYSQGIMDGSAFPVFIEFRTSPADALEPLLFRGVVVMMLFSALFQVLLAAGVVEVLTESGRPHPFLSGVRRNTGRFIRSAAIFLVPTIVSAVAAGLTIKGGGSLAKHFADGRWDLAGMATAGLAFLLIWAPADLAYDLSRVAAVRHNHPSMFRGFFRALVVVLKNPGTFVPLYLVFLALPIGVVALYSAFRQPWTPASGSAVVLLALIHQILMAVRAFFKIGFWATEVEVFRDLGEPPFCRGKRGGRLDPLQSNEVTEEPLDLGFATADAN